LLFSQDDDLLAEAHARQLQGIPFPGVVFAQLLKVLKAWQSKATVSLFWNRGWWLWGTTVKK
jgi:hypothetical protein